MTDFVSQHQQQQIDELHGKLHGPQAAAAAVDLCSIWHTVTPYWSVIVGIASKIPIVGGAIAAILGAFAAAMNACCPSKAQAAGFEVTKDDQDQIHAAHAAVFGAEADW